MNQVKNVKSFKDKDSIIKMEDFKKKNIVYIKRMNENNIKINNPTSQEMDIFEKQEMSKNREVVTSKINKFYNWLMTYVPKAIKDKASKAYKLMKSKVLGLYKSVERTEQPTTKEETKQEIDFTPVEQAFNKVYRRYRVNGQDVNLSVNKDPVQIFFNKIRKNLIDLIIKQLEELKSAKIQTNLGIKWMKEEEDGTLTFIDRFYYSKMTEFFQGSDLK